MGTRAVIAVQHYMNGAYELWYRHLDGYPSGVGIQIVEALEASQLLGKDFDPLLAEFAEQTSKTVKDASDAFPNYQADLEYIYVIDNVRDPRTVSLTILRTSNPKLERDFSFSVFFSYLKFMPHGADLLNHFEEVERTSGTILNALKAYEEAAPRVSPIPALN